LVSDIPAGDGKLVNLFLRCIADFLKKDRRLAINLLIFTLSRLRRGGLEQSHNVANSSVKKKTSIGIVFYSFYEICFLCTVHAARPQEASFTFETCLELCIKLWKFIYILLVMLLIYFLLPFVNNIDVVRIHIEYRFMNTVYKRS
jgi:hypothetical protein